MKIEDIASVHLGKAGDGSVVKPYVTPTAVDPSLLVAIPRALNREQYKIADNSLPFVGRDIWNAYEFSTLLRNGYPLSGVLRIQYPASSTNIVESKSLKLYLNSYNMYKIADTYDAAIRAVEDRVQEDLYKILGPGLSTKFITNVKATDYLDPISLPSYAINLDDSDLRWFENIEFSDYKENADLLRVRNNKVSTQHFVHSHSLRSNCRVTNQPDWGDVYIYYKSKNGWILPGDILKYIVSMRNENHFHEEVTECIYTRFWNRLQPEELMVACLYTRRGGIDINPVRASSYKVLGDFANGLCSWSYLNTKTMRQ